MKDQYCDRNITEDIKYIKVYNIMFKDIYRQLLYAYINYWPHKITLLKPESLCMHSFSAMLYNVDARMLLSNTRQR